MKSPARYLREHSNRQQTMIPVPTVLNCVSFGSWYPANIPEAIDDPCANQAPAAVSTSMWEWLWKMVRTSSMAIGVAVANAVQMANRTATMTTTTQLVYWPPDRMNSAKMMSN